MQKYSAEVHRKLQIHGINLDDDQFKNFTQSLHGRCNFSAYDAQKSIYV